MVLRFPRPGDRISWSDQSPEWLEWQKTLTIAAPGHTLAFLLTDRSVTPGVRRDIHTDRSQ